MMKKKHCGILQITEEMKADKETKSLMCIYIKYEDNVNRDNIEQLIRIKLKQKIFFFTDRGQSVNYINYEQTLLQIDSFSYISPSILLLMAILLRSIAS